MFNSKDEGTIWDRLNNNNKVEYTEMEKEYCQDEIGKGSMKVGVIAFCWVVGIILAGVAIHFISNSFVKVDATNWVISQSISGKFEVLDRPGFHVRPFATTWTFKRYSNIKMEDNLTFKEGRSRKVDTYIRVKLPESTEDRMELYQRFGGEMHSVEEMVDAIVTNAIKFSAASMSSHKFDVDGKPEIVRLVEAEITKPLAHYGLTLNTFGIYNATIPADEIPQGEQTLLDEIEEVRASHDREVRKAIKEADEAIKIARQYPNHVFKNGKWTPPLKRVYEPLSPEGEKQ
jgi:hypothetical protein